jgi:hypothetical protein
MSGKQVCFPPFLLDISNQCLQRGSEKVFLRPKSLAVLAHSVEHPHRWVSKEELMFAACKVSIEEAVSISRRSNEHHCDSELYRLKGELFLKKSKRISEDNFKEAEKCFLLAIDIARKQTAPHSN